MKTLIGAIAFILAAPLAAQTTPAADPHAGHAQHQPQKPSNAPSEHEMDCKCCDKDKHAAAQKACCADHADGKAAEHGSHGAAH